MRWTWLLILAGIPCFSGCLAVPYVANVTGPIEKVRVLDAETGQDIPDARVAFDTEYLPRGMLQPNYSMGQAKPEDAAKSLSRGELTRRSDQSFSVPWRIGRGCVYIPLIAANYDGSLETRTYALLTAVAPGYHAATLCTSGNGIRDAGRLVEFSPDLDSLPAAERQSPAFARREPSFCEYKGKGVVSFYLRRAAAVEEGNAIRQQGTTHVAQH
jgi:hypothetical protein